MRACVQRCQFTWYVDDEAVAETTDEAAAVGQLAGTNAGWASFGARSELRQAFAPGVHQVRVVAVDAGGRVMAANAVVRAEALALPATDTELPAFGRGDAATGGPRTIIALLVGIAVGAVVLLTPRRRTASRAMATQRQRGGRLSR